MTTSRSIAISSGTSLLFAYLLTGLASTCAAQDQSDPVLKSPTPAASDAPPTMEIYGFVEGDAIFDFKVNDPDWYDVNRPSRLPAFPGEFGRDRHFFVSPRQTRFGVKTTLPTAAGDVHTTFEFDMLGVRNNVGQTAMRLRHAWGQWKQIGAGQTFSQFMDADIYPNRFEPWGPSAMLTTRNPQVFWQPYQEGGSNLRIALENPGGTADGGDFAEHIGLPLVEAHFPMPDITGHYRRAESWGYVQVGGVARYLGFDDVLADDLLNLTDHVWGWGLSLSSNVTSVSTDVVRLQLVYGHAIENYVNDAPIDVGAKLNPGNAVTPIVGEALPVLGVVAYLDHNWTKTWSTSVGYSRVDVSNSDGQAARALRTGQYSTANILCTPVTNVLLGVEFQWARRSNFSDGFSVNDFRLDFSVRYSFAYTLGGQK